MSTQGSYKGWKAIIVVGGSEIGYTESVTVDVATGLEPYYEHGSRYPADLAEGNEEVTGSISRAWIDMDLMTYAVTNDPDGKGSTAALTAFDLYMYLDPYLTGAPYMYVYGCKAESGAFDIPQDGFVMGDIDFRALYLWYGLKT